MLAEGTAIALGLAALGGVTWAVRQEGRINGHDKLFEEREKLADERHEDNRERLSRIERKLDALPSVIADASRH